MVAERENIQVTEEKELLQQRTQGSRNEMEIVFDAVSCNESFARVAVAAFITHLNPTLEELADIKTAVSEAVTNAIIHGYENLSGYTKHGEMRPAYSIIHPGKVRLHCILENDTLSIEVSDQVKFINGFHQTDDTDLEQILRVITSAQKSFHNVMHQSQIFLDQYFSRFFISAL
jgi:stage II sporulation protein AB (anti-sigma F factor)